MQRAILHSQSSFSKEVTCAHALRSIRREALARRANTANHGITRFESLLPPGVARMQFSTPRSRSRRSHVVLYNDDYTPMEFVVGILQKFFSMTRDDATEAMLEVHRKGGVCGLYARDEAVELMKTVLATPVNMAIRSTAA